MPSTVNGLATAGYISSSQLTSTTTGLGSTVLPSTVNGLATAGYISSTQLTSSINGLGRTSYISSTQLTSTTAGLATIGYISSSQLTSTITGLGSTVLPSTVNGLGRSGYISTSQLTSTVTGIGTGSGINQTQLVSSIDGLGTVGYISTSQLTSTVSGLGSGSAANWATYYAVQSVDMSNNSISNINSLILSNSITVNQTTLTNSNVYNTNDVFGGYNGLVVGGLGQFTDVLDIEHNMNEPTLQFHLANGNYIRIIAQTEGFGDVFNLNAHIDLGGNNFYNVNAAYLYTLASQIDHVDVISHLNMCNNQISNIQVNYSNTFSNTSVVASLLSASPQTFSGAIYDQLIPSITYSNSITGSESNYLYFVKNQTMWKIHITMAGVFSTSDTTISFYFTLSNSTSAIETPFSIYRSNSPFVLYLPGPYQNVSLSLNDSVNLNDILNSSILPYTPISLNIYCSENGNNFTSSNIGNWTNPINLSALTVGNGVAYGNNTWMVVGTDGITGYIATSYDNGRSWVGTDLSGFTSTAYCVAYGNGIWVIGCDGGAGPCILYSTDGTNFSDSGSTFFSQTRGVAYGNGIFIATGTPNYPYPIVYSTDGIHWSPCSYSPANGGLDVTYANGLFVVVGDDGAGALLTSQNGTSWQQYNFATYLLCTAYGAGRWFASDGTGNLYYSTDNWYSYSSISEPYYLYSLAFGDTFVGIDGGSGIYSSPDFGTTWNSQSEGFGGGGRGIAYGNGMYVACGNNGDSNCILIASATNTISYSLEPTTIQPQYNVLPAPVIDWNNVSINGSGNLVISWFSVPNATHYKIFRRNVQAQYINKYSANATVTRNNSLNANMFDSDSGILTGTSYEVAASTGDKWNYYVFAYNNGVRSAFPSTQILDWNGILELWPVEQCEFHGGTNMNDFTSVTARNLYTNQCMVVLSNDWLDGTFGNTQLPQLGLDTFLSNY